MSHEILVGFYGYVIEIENLETFRFYHMIFFPLLASLWITR